MEIVLNVNTIANTAIAGLLVYAIKEIFESRKTTQANSKATSRTKSPDVSINISGDQTTFITGDGNTVKNSKK